MWVNIWVDGATAGSNAYTMTVGSSTIWSQSSTDTHVALPWATTNTPNGPQTLVAAVRDASGNTGSGSVSVTVQNGSPPPPLAASFTSPAAGATVASTVTVGLAASGGTAPYTYRLSVDGAQVFSTTTSATTASFSWNTTTAANGSHTLGLTVTDSQSGSASASRSVTVQNAAPPPPLAASFTSPAAGATVANTVTVGLAASGGTAPYTYRLSVDGAQVFSTTTTATTASFSWNTTTVANSSHTLGLTVTDSQSGSASASRSVTVQNAATPPPLTASFTSPAAGATVSGSVNVGLAASGGTTPYTYRLSVDGAQVFSNTTNAKTKSYGWKTKNIANGTHTLTLTVTDAQSRSASASRDVTVQNGSTSSLPSVGASFTSPAAGATVASTVSVGLAASGGTAPYTYRLTVDGAQVFSTTTSATTASFAWNTTTVANGSHALGLTITDSAGGSGSATRSVTVSNASAGPLHVTLTTPTPGATVSGTVWVNIWVEGAAAGSNAYTMTVGGSTVWSQSSTDVPTALPWVTTNTPNGQRTLVVTVRDSANATGTASVSVTVSNP